MYVCNKVSKGGPEPLIVSLHRHALKPFFFGETDKMTERGFVSTKSCSQTFTFSHHWYECHGNLWQHSRSLILTFIIQSKTISDVCLGSFFCWNTQLSPSFNRPGDDLMIWSEFKEFGSSPPSFILTYPSSHLKLTCLFFKQRKVAKSCIQSCNQTNITNIKG